MGCDQCGCPTPRSRICKQCAILERAEERASHGSDPEWPECPECSGITSGEGVVCAECRRDEIATDGGADPWCDWCQQEFGPKGPTWKVDGTAVTAWFCSKSCAEAWGCAADTPEKVGSHPLTTALELATDAVEAACVTSEDDILTARLSLAVSGVQAAISSDVPTVHTVLPHDVDWHLSVATEVAEHDDIAVAAGNALQLVRAVAGGERTW